ncbi:MAG: bifunctional acetaldehyde-CoA/alcohol dehydrogenase [Bifidobacteriaceae bacterium]|jgi:acetaldehyde dehydrogenase/alcohol dehydrogenase|nr:bifunctional acetaldehyde-CoA/alcohol dehydrogenase [Bifidobacteriaceae bacterium]
MTSGVNVKTGQVAEVNQKVSLALKALDEFYKFNQTKIDHIVSKMSVAGLNAHLRLAKDAVDETKRGRIEDKAVKNIFACEHVTHYLKKQKTVGIISEDSISGIIEIADPVGVIAGVTPVTNPTSTVIFKSLLAMKTRNPIIFGFHPNAQKCSVMAAKVMLEAAVKAGAPKNCIQWIEKPSIEATNALMHNDGVATILATGGNAMVKAAYSCGKPALGVGAGNVPVYVERTADLDKAANDIIISKNFDYGMVCASEQAVIIDKEVYSKFLNKLKNLKAYVCTPVEKAKLEQFIFGVKAYSKNCALQRLNPDIVGQSPEWIAEQAGFKVPKDTSVILAEITKVGSAEPLSSEKLSPVLAVLSASNTKDAFAKAEAMLENGGLGHSACIHSNNRQIIKDFGLKMKACRILENSPTSLGGIGDVYNAIIPSLTLGCGSYGRNSVSNNIQAINLVNIKRIGRRNNNMQWFKIPPKIYIEPNSIQYLRDMADVSKVVIVTDKVMSELGIVQKIIDELNVQSNAISTRVIDFVEPEPSIETVQKGAEFMRQFKPDTIVALGGGSPMDAAKVMWLLYENPDITFSDIREKFFDIRKRAFTLPALGKLAKLVCIPTSSGTGSEVTPFAVITDHKTGYKYPLADYCLTPSVAIVDPVLAATQPKTLACDSGFDALTHAIEAYVSTYANDFTDGLALHAIRLIWDNLADSVIKGSKAVQAREKMHNAATIAGMAFGSAFLGLCHGMAHTIGATFHIAHGRTNSILLPNVIRYNASSDVKPTSWPKYDKYKAAQRYQDIAQLLHLKADTSIQGAESLAKAIENLRSKLGMSDSLKSAGVKKADLVKALDAIAMRAYEDQCTPANPRVPILEDIKMIAMKCFDGEVIKIK